MPRRSARLANSVSKASNMESLAPIVVDDKCDSTVDPEDYNEEILKPKRKRQKKSTKPGYIAGSEFKNVRGRRGALKDIVEMPLDILHEVFMYLTSPDILHLSRMCKALRRILMAKSAEFIWKQARFNLGDFPDCPEDLNEAQLACLIFDTLCDYCNEQKARHFLWSVRRRCCKKCITNRNGLQPFYDLPQFFSDASYTLRAILPSFNASGSEVSSNLDQDAVICVMSAAKIRDEFLKLENEAQESWRQNKTKERQDRLYHGHLCEQWMARQTEIRACRLNDARWRRYKAIKQKLIDLGWGEELELINDFRQWSSVKQPKDLTDRIWLNIKNDLIERLKEHKTLRLEKDQRVAQNERSLRLSSWLYDLRSSTALETMIFPPIADLRQTEPFSSLIMAPALEKVEFSRSMLEEATQNWRTSKEPELRDMIISGSSPISGPTSVDILSLATTFFRCWRFRSESWNCGTCTIGFPEVLVHRCASNDNSMAWNGDGKRVFFDQKAHSLAKTILEASGLDYNITTRKEVHRPDFYIECHECSSTEHSNGERVLLTWHSAIEHAFSHPSQDTSLRMARAILSNSELKVVKELESDQLRSDGFADYKCIRCEEPSYIGTWHELSAHIFHDHGRDGPPIYLKDYDFVITESGFRPYPEGPLIFRPINNQGTINKK